MKIVWLSWKDIRHPEAGGAELVAHDWMRRLVAAGHEVVLVTARYAGSAARDVIDGIDIRRTGDRVSHYFQAARLFARELRADADLVVEEINTVPYLASYYARGKRTVLFYPQLAREIWFHQMPFPLSVIGYALEPIYTWLQGRPDNDVVTISDDSRNDLVRYGFRPQRVRVVTLGIDNRPLTSVDPAVKESGFTVLFHSSLRPMKRPMDAFAAFAQLSREAPDCRMWISGGGDQSELRRACAVQGVEGRVTFFGRTSQETKLDLMRRASVLCSTSVKEGWGLVVTEANSMGTPAVVYDVDGLRSAAKAGGNWISASNPKSLAERLREAHALFSAARPEYDDWCRRVHATTGRYTYEESYREFAAIARTSTEGSNRRAG